ncbi:MAG TPA: Ig-like domain-containing protein [Actinomycetes bacterium]|nr:Ig-like domain-containing protein [Actinomycetes bacterium]
MTTTGTTNPQRRVLPLLGAAVAAMMALAACTNAGADGGDDGPVESRAVIAVPGAKNKEFAPTRPIVVKAEQGTLTRVTVTDERGRKLAGTYRHRHMVWTSKEAVLPFDMRYRVVAGAKDSDGVATRTVTWLKTVKPKRTAYTGITPYGGAVVGVGMPIIMTFDQPVKRKPAVEQRLSVNTKPAAVGSWYWVNDQMVRWRPKEYWRPGTDVTVRSRLEGVNFGDGVWGDDADMARFSIGAATVSTVDIAHHTMTITQNGKVLRKVPITTGKSGWDTRVGTKVIISKDREVVMDAASIDVDQNDPEYYRLRVEYAMRLTWSGEYVHAAPWSEDDQGEANVSHGCTGMSMADATWFYNLSKVGDIVKYVNGTRQPEAWNGYTDWNLSWQEWQKGSAL